MKKRSRLKKAVKRNLILIAALIAIISVILKTVPVFMEMLGDKEMTLEVFSDFEDPGAISTITNETITGKGEVDTSVVGDYIVKYHGFLQTFKRKVHVVDTTEPVIEIAERDLMILKGDDYSIPEAVAVDNYDKDLSKNITISDDIDNQKAGTYSIVYSVIDRSGNSTEKSLNVYVLEDDFDYLDRFDNKEGIDETALDVISRFLNRYYRSLKYLEAQDCSDLFSSAADDEAYQINAVIELICQYRKQAYADLRLDDCSYTIHVQDSYPLNSTQLKVIFTEDCDMSFHFLNGVPSSQYQVWNCFTLSLENGEYRLSDVEREEGLFLYFDSEYSGLGKSQIDEIQQKYSVVLDEAIAADETACSIAVSRGSYAPEDSDHAYDREAAGEYALAYAVQRNKEYGDYESNCVNFVSQCIHAGGIPMDADGYYQWKYYSDEYDESNDAYGYSYSWTYIPSFVNYLENGEIVTFMDADLYSAQTGDVIAVSMEDVYLGDVPHVLIVSDVVKDEEGNILDILICGNTNDQLSYPLSALTYPYKYLISILGYQSGF